MHNHIYDKILKLNQSWFGLFGGISTIVGYFISNPLNI